jgi:hypothetical protein
MFRHRLHPTTRKLRHFQGDVRDPDEPLVFERDRTIDNVADVSQWSFLEEIICSDTASEDHLDRFDMSVSYSDLTPGMQTRNLCPIVDMKC